MRWWMTASGGEVIIEGVGRHGLIYFYYSRSGIMSPGFDCFNFDKNSLLASVEAHVQLLPLLYLIYSAHLLFNP
jgi:hypothetical protein